MAVGEAAGQAAFAALVLLVLLALRAAALDLAFNPRLVAVLAVLTGAAALAALLLRLVARPLLARLRPVAAVALLAVLLLCATLAAAGLIFSIIVVDVAPVEAPDEEREFGLIDWLGKHAIAAYVMLVAGWDLLFPWVLPIQSLVWAAAMARLARPAGGRG